MDSEAHAGNVVLCGSVSFKIITNLYDNNKTMWYFVSKKYPVDEIKIIK